MEMGWTQACLLGTAAMHQLHHYTRDMMVHQNMLNSLDFNADVSCRLQHGCDIWLLSSLQTFTGARVLNPYTLHGGIRHMLAFQTLHCESSLLLLLLRTPFRLFRPSVPSPAYFASFSLPD